MEIRILDIIKGTTVDGPGFRTAIYMAGCRHNCVGCHNPESWSFDGGYIMNLDELIRIISEEDFDVTLTGGDPMYHPEATKALIDATVSIGHTVWVYTGFTIEQIMTDPVKRGVLKNVEAIVDGPFIQHLHDADLPFRGSTNQRIIYASEFNKFLK